MSFNSGSPDGPNNTPPSENSPNSGAPTAPASAPRASLDSSRSCVTCRRRKVRCNKRSPCSNCARAGIDCIFPPPGRAPRKSKRPPDAELLSRLRRLEGVIEHLSGKNGEEQSPESLLNVSANTAVPATSNTTTKVVVGTAAAPTDAKDGTDCPFADSDPKKIASHKFENEFGRLVIDEGKSRYVSNRLWASLGDEIEELQDILDPSESEGEDYPSPESSQSGSHDSFLFGFYSVAHSLREYHPPLQHVSKLWDAYKDNVAPLVVILHRPSARNLLIEAARSPENLDKNSEALVFAIYLSAIVSLKPDECVSLLGEDRATLVRRYRFAVEQALARANFLNTQSMVLLQAAVLFLTSIRREDDSKFNWSMDGLVVRIAQGLGLHRDGTNFGLKPFETEMRRRLWWHICLMDIRSSEDHGSDPLIHENMFDVRLPLNVNDEDLYPEMVEPPQERVACTDVTFCLIRCEITGALRRANYTCRGSSSLLTKPPQPTALLSGRIEERYIQYCNMDVPIHWASATVARLILAKLWLIIHHPMTRKDRQANLPKATRHSLFMTSIELLEFGRLLETDPKTARWGWLFRCNVQWHAVAFVLSEICVRPICPVTDRAWNAVNGIYSDWKIQGNTKKGMLWRPLDALMKRAKATRIRQQEELRLKFGPHISPTDFTPVSGNLHPLPQIHMPESAEPPPYEVNQNMEKLSALPPTVSSIDLGGPWQTLQNIFPDTNILAPVENDISTLPMPEPASSSILPSGLSFNDPINTSFDAPEAVADQTQLSWEEWDQVMRDFQLDVENDGSTTAQNANVTEWFV
ncbi:hypothetical protein N7470_008276 [Penicillium chermesinum]|nr:hypothetical protein N7470_008276 [Penicillium chermesinum]